MLKQYATLYRRLMMIGDGAIAGGAFFLAFNLRQLFGGYYPLSACAWILPTVVVLWVGLFYFFGLYSSLRLKSVSVIIYTIFKVAVICFLVFGSITFFLALPYVGRSFILFLFAISTQLFMIERILLVFLFRHLRRKGFNYRNVLIVGTGPRAQRFMNELDQHRELGLNIVGVVDGESGTPEIMGHRVMGTLQDIPDILKHTAVDYVVFIVPRGWLDKIEAPILYCETVGVSASVAIDLFDLQFAAGVESELLGFPLLTFECTSDKVGQLFLKRVLDFVLSGLALLILSPLLVLIAILIKVTSSGPVFFKQIRSGLNGREFSLYKFRTMGVDAESKLDGLRHLNEMEGPVFKIEHDPRITPLGRILRKFSLDELPQFWNVFKGEMSLVGPRPPIPKEVSQYNPWQRRRLSMRPGITCFWQVNGRNQITDFNQWMKMDLDYIDHWSFWEDIAILIKTVPVVLLAKGAK